MGNKGFKPTVCNMEQVVDLKISLWIMCQIVVCLPALAVTVAALFMDFASHQKFHVSHLPVPFTPSCVLSAVDCHNANNMWLGSVFNIWMETGLRLDCSYMCWLQKLSIVMPPSSPKYKLSPSHCSANFFEHLVLATMGVMFFLVGHLPVSLHTLAVNNGIYNDAALPVTHILGIHSISF